MKTSEMFLQDVDFFGAILDHRLESIKEVLGTKAKEYVRNNDRFHNFKVAARRRVCTPERALMGMKEKHSVSIEDIIDDIDKGVLPNVSLLSEKIGDEINYLILLEGMIRERIIKGVLDK